MGKAKAKVEINPIQEEDDVEVDEVFIDSEEDNDRDDGDDDDDDDDDETENDEDDDDNPSEGLIDEDDDDEDYGFELQSSSDEGADSDKDSDDLVDEEDDDGDDNRIITEVEKKANRKAWSDSHHRGSNPNPQALLEAQKFMHYDDLSSDDEDAGDNPNTIGRVPLHWYDAFDHVGYDVGGSKVVKRKGTDRIDQLLAHRDDPEARRTIYDMYNDRDIVLTEREMEIIRRVQAGAFAHPEFDDTPDYVDYYSSVKELMPLSSAPEPKRRFVPSKWEMMKVMKIVKAIKEGRYKESDKSGDAKDKKPPVYLIWNDEEDDVIAESKRHQFHLPAPKLPLPGHAESYNPPREYLLTDKEKEDLNELDPKDRPYNFEPKAHDCLRHVAGYENFLKERFERCLDLYLCPRKLKRRLNIDPETLVPRLPSPNELKPFPNTLCLQYLGHDGPVRSVSISPDGEYLASGGDDGTVRLWEIDTCLCRYVWDLKNQLKLKSDLGVSQVSWNPDSVHAVLIAVMGKAVVFIATGTGDIDSTELTDTYLSTIQSLATTSVVVDGAVAEKKKGDGDDDDGNVDHDDNDNDDVADGDDEDDNGKKRANKSMSRGKRIQGKWLSVPSRSKVFKGGSEIGPRVVLQTDHQVTLVAWHYKGDYLSVLATNAGAQAVSIYQVRRWIDGWVDRWMDG